MSEWIKFILRIIGWLVLAVFVFMVGPGFFVLILVLGLSMRAVRRQRESIILSLLAMAVRLNLPIGRMLALAGASEGRVMRERSAALNRRLAEGLPLSAALQQAVPELSRRDLALIDAGEQSGQLKPTILRIAHRHFRERFEERLADGTAFRRLYTVILIIMLSAIISMVGYYVYPRLMDVLVDFDRPVPAPTRWLKVVLHVVTNVGYMALVGGGAAFLGLWLFRSAFRARPMWVNLPMHDGWLWWLPLYGRVVRNRNMADVCHVIGDAVGAGEPIHRAVYEARKLPINGVLKRRLDRWLRAMESGRPINESARAAKLPKMLTGLLTQATGSQTADTFQFLAGYYASRMNRALLVVQTLHLPAMLVVFGGLTLLVALALFVPMVDLIDHLNMTFWGY